MPLRLISRRQIVSLAGSLPIAAALTSRGFAAAAPLKIGCVGAGRMGSGLGTAWAKAGHDVMFSSRHPETLKDLVEAAGPKARAGTVKDAIAFGDIIVLLIPYSAMPDLAKEFGKALAAKPLVLDVSNPIPQRDGPPGEQALAEGPGEYLTRLMPGIRLARAFNSVGFNTLANPPRPDGGPQGVAVVGDDPKALEIAQQLVRDAGFEPVVIGSLAKGRYLYGPEGKFGGIHTPAKIREIAATLK